MLFSPRKFLNLKEPKSKRDQRKNFQPNSSCTCTVLFPGVCLAYALEHVLFMLLYIIVHAYVTQSIQMPKHCKYTYDFILLGLT